VREALPEIHAAEVIPRPSHHSSLARDQLQKAVIERVLVLLAETKRLELERMGSIGD
jgi:hypothetical protein